MVLDPVTVTAFSSAWCKGFRPPAASPQFGLSELFCNVEETFCNCFDG